MSEEGSELAPVSPEATLLRIGEAVPEACRKNIVVIGSLAVGYHFLRGSRKMDVRTKDVDCLLSPRAEAISAGLKLTEDLLAAGWTRRPDPDHPVGGPETPVDQLPAVRLYPPGETGWFLELLTVPESPNERKRQWIRLAMSDGHFGLPSFGFLSLANSEPVRTESGIGVARPEMMALANLLEHPSVGPERMSGLIAGRRIKRSNKDLGRVLAIAHLAGERDEDVLLQWPELWAKALVAAFSEDWRQLAARVGSGLRSLLASEPDLEEAWHTCQAGLLAGDPPTLGVLKIAGQRLVVDTIEPLEKL